MRNAVYIGVLLAIVGSVMAHTYAKSEVRAVKVTDKYVENVRGRWGRTTERYVLRTADGDLPILEFPLIGYTFGAEEIYAGIAPGDALEVRVAQWPPRILGDRGRLRIMDIR